MCSLRYREYNLELVKLDLNRPLAEQGPFVVVVHKLCDMLIKEIGGDSHAASICKQFDELCLSNPRMRVIDPLSSVRAILDRNSQYQMVKAALDRLDDRVSVPPFVRLDAAEPDANIRRVRENRLKFPLVCKPIVAHGTEAHTMCLVFNECGLRKLGPVPCVAQQFVPHGSIVYKVFDYRVLLTLGSKFQVIKRPSFKNVTAVAQEDLIEFHSHDISKPGASSPLTDREAWLRPDERGDAVVFSSRLVRAVEAVWRATRQTLCGIDFIVEEETGWLYVIDVNNFPGYSGMENFLWELTQLIRSTAMQASTEAEPTNGLVVT
ncbi:inositol-tetrakisphosphate 1-kinase-like [Tropilaelaps mercedesae]|uniref:Inositol-tetrakisphosphate 1-kinase n=1 Tax=Tropilaelaps mercedesae TaxID=418985 RepID=A0A1V9XI03_9ACAR|nr:inositol-tetrakisphosphate 1-kinase-like [Tropilaelaps mercedesae]